MKYILPICFAIVFTACSGGDTNVNNDSANSDSTNVDSSNKNMGIGGTYGFGSNPDVEAVGTIFVYPETDSTFLFYLDFTRGAPSYNMGQVASRARLRNGTWTYNYIEPDELDACAIDFMFTEKFVQIVTRETGCGFGANVIVDHVYDRTSSAIPEFFMSVENDTVFFSNLAKAVK